MFEIKSWKVSAQLVPEIEVPESNKLSKRTLKRKRSRNEGKRPEKKLVHDPRLSRVPTGVHDHALAIEHVDTKSCEEGEKHEQDLESRRKKPSAKVNLNSGQEANIGKREQLEYLGDGTDATESTTIDKTLAFKKQSRDIGLPDSRGFWQLTEESQEMGTGKPALTSLQSKMSHKLASARFRYLNEQLYTKQSSQSLNLFKQNPDLFDQYHKGFAQQVTTWPENPTMIYVKDILKRAKIHPKRARKQVSDGVTQPLPRSKVHPHECIIADLGCGAASLATALQSHLSRLKLNIYSFDLHAPNKFVTQADIANLPLKDEEVDVAVFCLALMGTNWPEFVSEAWRVLRPDGELWVAEIKSRFNVAKRDSYKEDAARSNGSRTNVPRSKIRKSSDNSQEQQLDTETLEAEVDAEKALGTGTDVRAFVAVLEQRGFSLSEKPDMSNKMFVKMRFVKPRGSTVISRMTSTLSKQPNLGSSRDTLVSGNAGIAGESSVLKPCLYKVR